MDREILVQNIKLLCEKKGIKQTVACRESGVGVSFVNDIVRGQTPSVAKVQMLANYLGVTTSELLGEENKKPAAENGDGVSENEAIFRALPPDLQEEALRYMRYLAAQAGTREDPKD